MKITNAVKPFASAFTILLLVSLLLSACGSGGSGSSSSQTDVQSTSVAGIAAAGAPLAGRVHLYDSSSFKTYSSNSPINRDGSFSINTTGMTAPFILHVVDAQGQTLYNSFAKAPGIANINPLTNLAVAAAVATGKDISVAMGDIKESLNDLLKRYYPVNTVIPDPLSDPYQINNQGFDGLFDDVLFAINDDDGTVNITRKDTDTTIYSSSISNLSTFDTDNLPTPTSYPVPGNAELTLKFQGDLPSGTLVKNVSFSVKLPLGISVILDSSGGNGLTAVENTAIAVGAATGSNVYPPPTLSGTNNILSVSMTSVAGFGLGDFIKIRCIVSNPSLMDATTPDSFSVTESSIYADIYNNQKLRDLSIVPVTFLKLQ